ISVGTLQAGLGNNTHHITGLPYNEPVTVRFVAVDVAGNKSDPSVSVTISTKPIVDTDLIGRIIADANIKLGAIKSELIADQAILTDKLADNAVSLGKLDTATRDTLTNASADATLANGRLTTSTAVPITANGAGKPVGAIWYRYSGNGTLLSTWRWNGTIWEQQTWGQDAIGVGAIVKEKLADNIVDSTKLAVAVNNAITQAGADASAALTAANGKNRILRSTSVASGTAYNNGDQWWQFSGSQIIGMWIFNNGGWVQQTLTSAVITNLDAGVITAGILSANILGARSITAEKLVLGNFENLFPNGSFTQGLAGWSASTPSIYEAATVTNGPQGATSTIV
ncbi:MAG: hypothetical protein RR853_08800, partial [Aurantimicrobium sp.]|uniref:hypothetical protein n=1 Tax=Aurantimicrobium sp. TaxID=1930784 RepID=UPI002FCB1520